MDSKTAISLVSVALGWLLGQGTAIVRDWRSRRRLKDGLLTELKDIRQELSRVTTIHMRQLQILAHNGIEGTYASPIHNLFFKHYYKDVFAWLNREQRLSYQSTHSAIELLNKGNEDLAQYLHDTRDLRRSRPPALSEVADWGERVKALYVDARTAAWYVENHLAHQRSPVLDTLGPVHESFLKFQQRLEGEIADLMTKAKSLNPEDFAKIYDERAFRPSASNQLAEKQDKSEPTS